MKYKVIKAYAGIEVDSIVNLADSHVNHMIQNGYVEPIIEPVDSLKIEFAPAQNKAIEPKYKKNRNAN